MAESYLIEYGVESCGMGGICGACGMCLGGEWDGGWERPKACIYCGAELRGTVNVEELERRAKG